ncbi:MAG: hypothetical protein SOZ96_08045 [Treponema sp.]|nr:hypothetical protein [Treponema sp.]
MQSLILLDAMGGAIHHIGNVHKYAREEDLPEKTIFVITTGGQENASSEYSYEKIQKLVKRQTENESKLECRYHRAL